VKITPDTNLLVRALVDDEPRQAELARSALRTSEIVALTTVALCEAVWVLRSAYRLPAPEIASSLRVLLSGANVVADDAIVGAGLTHLDAGGDFADGVIAAEGALRGGDEFVSFDRQAVRVILANGGRARLLR
jgi:predicted nucleic-acid-binding protein